MASELGSRLLTHLRDAGPTSRAELAARVDAPRPRTLAEIDALVRSGTVREAGDAPSRGGRRSTLVELAPDIRFAAIDIGASSVHVEIVDGRLAPVAAHREPVDIRSGPEAVLAVVDGILGKFKAEFTAEFTAESTAESTAEGRLYAIGVGVPGPVSFRDGVPVSPTMPGWDRYPVRDRLAGEHLCPVVVDNDVNMMAVGERHAGVARSADTLLFVKIGTGIGCGIHLDGRLYRGPDGCAGEIGHIQLDENGPICACGNSGCLEAYFGGAALARDAVAAARAGTSASLAAKLATGDGPISAEDVAAGAAAGDATCVRLIRDGGRRVGAVLAGLVSFINPSMIVIGGGLVGLGPVLLAEIRGVVYRRSPPLATGSLPVVRSRLGPRAGVAGAALLASNAAYGERG